MKYYIQQDGCHNCDYVFEKYDYENSSEYYCTFNAPERPPCMSVAMGEYEHGWGSSYFNDWDNWREKRRVHAWGICGRFKMKEQV